MVTTLVNIISSTIFNQENILKISKKKCIKRKDIENILYRIIKERMFAPPDNPDGLLDGRFRASLQPVCRKLVFDRALVFLQQKNTFMMSKIFAGLTLEDWHASHEQPALLYNLTGHCISLTKMVKVKKCGEQITYLGGQVLTQDLGSDKQDLGKSWPLRSRPRDPADWETCYDHLDIICFVGSLEYKMTTTLITSQVQRLKIPLTSTSLLSLSTSILH